MAEILQTVVITLERELVGSEPSVQVKSNTPNIGQAMELCAQAILELLNMDNSVAQEAMKQQGRVHLPNGGISPN